jgi:two-component system response regulator YesN
METVRRDLGKYNSKEALYTYLVEKIMESKKYILEDSKKDIRIKQMLLALYGNINKRNLSLQWLAKEVLFMNEDYLGKLFSKSMEKKFSTFILDIRIEMAKRLIQYDPEILISDLAEVVGYTADGQYFSKVFKEYTKMKPSQYRESLIEQKQYGIRNN